MKKKDIIIILISIVAFFAIVGFIVWAFYEQYNLHGVSHLLVITIDKNQEKEYLNML